MLSGGQNGGQVDASNTKWMEEVEPKVDVKVDA
jgi:hypothetical protein